jgi:cell division protein FtsB
MTLFVVLLLVLAGIGGIAYANRKAVLATEKADAAKVAADLKAAEAKVEAEVKKVL